MNPTLVEPVDSPEVVRETAGVDRVIRLLKIYRKKLLVALSDYSLSKGVSNASVISNTLHSLTPGVDKLAQYASGLIENARLSQLDKIELQLRVAELEAVVMEVRRMLKFKL